MAISRELKELGEEEKAEEIEDIANEILNIQQDVIYSITQINTER